MSDSNNTEQEFNGLQRLLWPIHNWEIKKFIPMAIMAMLTIYVYSILRSTKDSILVPMMGAEMISAVKIWGVFPSAILFMVLYSKLANIFSRENLYYIICSFFLGFFILYALVLSGHDQLFKLDLAHWRESIPSMRYPLIMVENWHHSLFYIMSELWGSVMLSLMFWQFANSIVKVDEAKRFYSLIGLLGQIGLISSGFIGAFLARLPGESVDAWKITLNYTTVTVVVAGVLLMMTYRWMYTNVLTDKRFYDPAQPVAKAKKEKVKLTLADSFKHIFSSKYLGLIALLVICYGVSINLVEGVWKKQLQIQYANKNDYSAYMGTFQIWTGVGTLIGMIVGQNILRRFSWTFGAILTPLMILITGALFFCFIIYRDESGTFLTMIGTTALAMAVFTGALQNILSKSTKYSLFDGTKEMAYIPLDDELKSKGKAAVDVVGARFGKSGGAIIQQVMLSLVVGSTLETFTIEIFVMFLVMMVLWIYSVVNLGKEFDLKNSQSN